MAGGTFSYNDDGGYAYSGTWAYVYDNSEKRGIVLREQDGNWTDIWFDSYAKSAVTATYSGGLVWTFTPTTETTDISDELNLGFTTDTL